LIDVAALEKAVQFSYNGQYFGYKKRNRNGIKWVKQHFWQKQTFMLF